MIGEEFGSLLNELRSSVRDFDIFEAAYLFGYSQREIAKRLGMSERMVRRRLKRVREQVAEMLENTGYSVF